MTGQSVDSAMLSAVDLCGFMGDVVAILQQPERAASGDDSVRQLLGQYLGVFVHATAEDVARAGRIRGNVAAAQHFRRSQLWRQRAVGHFCRALTNRLTDELAVWRWAPVGYFKAVSRFARQFVAASDVARRLGDLAIVPPGADTHPWYDE